MKRLFAHLLIVCLLLASAASADAFEPLELEEATDLSLPEIVEAALPAGGDIDLDLLPPEGGDLASPEVPVPVADDADPDSIPVDESHFPDPEFRRLITNKYANSDGMVSLERLAGVTMLDYYTLKDYSIASLKGIEYFTGLGKLDCADMKLTSLDVSRCTQLGTLSCPNNQLTSLNVRGCAKLLSLYCDGNQLTQLDVGGCPKLENLDCDDNLLTRLDLQGLTALRNLECSGNRLKALDAGSCANLRVLHCRNNRLESLKLLNDALYYVDCRDNPLKQLDISGCKKLIPVIANGWKDGCYIDYSAGVSLYCDEALKIVTEPGAAGQSLSGAKVTLSKDRYVYSGKPKKPAVTVTLEGKTLKKGTDYKVGYKDNTAIGTASVRVTGIGHYTDSVTVKFRIVGRPVLIAKALKLEAGKKKALVAAKSPVAAADCTFSSSDDGVAKVNASGVVTGVAAGKATITATAKDGGEKARCTVTVTEPWLFVVVAPTEMGVGEKASLTPTIPKGVTVKWSSSDDSIAKVNKAGVVKALRRGTVTITGKASSSASNGDTATCTITVMKAPSRVTVSPKRKTLTVGRTVDLKAKLPEGSASALRWSSSNTQVATVLNGRVKAVGGGVATITVRTFNGKKAQCQITVKHTPKAVALDRTELKLCEGEEAALKATLTPSDAYPDTLSWISSEEDVATVSDTGVVKALKKGKATIIVLTNNYMTAECQVTVVKPGIRFYSQVWNLGYSDSVDVQARLTAGKGKITYTSSNPDVATVSNAGIVMPMGKEGSTTITAKADVYGATVSQSHELWVYGEGKNKGFSCKALKTILSEFNTGMQGVVDDVVEVMHRTANAEEQVLEDSVNALIGVMPRGKQEAPGPVKTAFLDKLKEVIRTFDMGLGKYDDVKTDVDLVKRIMQQLMGKTDSFTFDATVDEVTKTYTAILDDNTPMGGAAFIGGWIIFPDNSRYRWKGVAVSTKNIQNQMNYLKEYAKIKIDDAKQAVISDAAKLLEIGAMKKAVASWLKSKAANILEEEFPRVYTWLTKVNKINNKYNQVKEVLKKATPPELDGKLAPDVVKSIAEYTNGFQEFIQLVEDLGGIDSLV